MKSIANRRALGLGVAVALAVSTLPLASASAATASPSLKAVSLDGSAFDRDEYLPGDISVQVLDSAKTAVDVDDSQDLNYFWTVKPFATGAAAVRVPATGTDVQATDTNGEFVVPLPTGQAPGTYVLTAGLGPDASNAKAIANAAVLTVKTGQAALTFTDSAPLRFTAGTSRTVAGALRLEDGTNLPGRLIDLSIDRGMAGTDPQADAGFVPADPAPAIVDSLQVTTAANGTFTTTLGDPAEEGQGTELGGTVEANTAATPDIGNADSGASLDVDLVSTTPPAGTEVTVSGLGNGTPGLSQSGTVTMTAPDNTFDTDPSSAGVQGDADSDRDPVVGQVYTLTVDRGFFTTGQGRSPSVVGSPAGDLIQLGTKLTGITNADGEVEFQTGIARDKGFDDDGKVAATVKAVAGSLSATARADWDTVNSLNGKVVLALAPTAEQENPVNPAVVDDRTYYDVFAQDQFGNRVGGKAIDLAYLGADDFDYSDESVESDFDTFGDIWVTSFKPAAIKIVGTWANAPKFTYVDTNGSTVSGAADATGSITASYYAVNFNSSKFSIRSSATDVVRVGSTVTHTVRVVDQKGNPVRGYEVRFFRYGPDKTRGDTVATRTTNSRGEASYTFVGNKLGRGQVSAEVSDGIRSRILRNTVIFGTAITAKLVKGKEGRGADRLTVVTKPIAAGARAHLYRVVKGKQYRVGIRTIAKNGKAKFTIRDRNRNSKTTYVAVVRSTSKTVADQSNFVKIR